MTWPTLCLSQNEEALKSLLHIDSIAGFRLYGADLRAWYSNLDVPLRVTPGQNIIICAPGVSDYADLQMLISKRKRRRSPSPLSCPSKAPRLTSPSSSTSSSPVLPSTPILPLTLPAPSDSDEVMPPSHSDSNAVQVPHPDRSYRWPKGMYVCDMARGFRQMKLAGLAKETYSLAFPRIFGGLPFQSSTFHTHRSAWDKLSDDMQQRALQAPRIDNYLWSKWIKNPC